MNILLISYDYYEYDGRLRELVKNFGKLGELTYICRGHSKNKNHITFNGNRYISFIKFVIKEAKKYGSIDVLVLDNRKAIIPGIILKHIIKPKVIIQDCRELYVINDVHHFIGKLGCIIESRMIKRVDIVVAANQERAEIMKELYKLNELPIVFENLRRLEYDDVLSKYEKKYGKYIHEDEFRIISTSGCSVSRTNDVLINNLDKIEKPIRVFLIGNYGENDKDIILKIIKEKGLVNVEIIDQLNQGELKWFINNAHIGIVNYHQNDMNNKFCASGKIYEFLYEGIPVITTTNPPLANFCKNNLVGISTDDYYDGINKMIGNYEYYKEKVLAFIKENTVEDNNKLFIKELEQRIFRVLNK